MLDAIIGQTYAVVSVDKLCENVSSLRTNETSSSCQSKVWVV